MSERHVLEFRVKSDAAYVQRLFARGDAALGEATHTHPEPPWDSSGSEKISQSGLCFCESSGSVVMLWSASFNPPSTA